MKRLITGGAACVLALAMTVSALAMWVPSDTTVQNLNGVQQYIKVFTVPADTNPEVLIEEPFEYEGFTYTFAEITKQEHTVEAQKEHTETLVVETQKKDLVNVLEVLTPTIEYDNGHYSGVLALDHTTIRTEPAGYTSGSYTIRETKEIGNLDSNDMAFVPQTTVNPLWRENVLFIRYACYGILPVVSKNPTSTGGCRKNKNATTAGGRNRSNTGTV